jgi:SsrA-binding protein
MSITTIATNRRAKFQFFLYDRYEAGIVLRGSEIKSIRARQVSLNEAYIRVDGEEAWLVDAYIAPYEQASVYNHDPRRPRKLLLHRKEINKLWDQVRQKGMTIIPVKLYLKNGLAKVEISVAKGKKLHDKRQVIAKRDAEREMARRLRRRK